MKVSAAILAIFLTANVAVEALQFHPFSTRSTKELSARSLPKRTRSKTCSIRKNSSNNSSSGSNSNGQHSSGGSGPSKNNSSSSSQQNDGVIHVNSHCGPTGATPKSGPTTGPNGSEDWLNCGINGGGWNPPLIHISDLKVVSLSNAVKDPNSPFQACSKYLSLFNKYGGEFNVPPIMLASFALQESSCNPSTVGGAGEQGLMQITPDKCGGAPGGNCKDPDFNIRVGALYFSNTLKSNNGDVLLSIGEYNGWYRGLTYQKATAARYTSCCRCQNNLDYLHQFLNGWCQNVNAYSSTHPLGKYFNLDVCH